MIHQKRFSENRKQRISELININPYFSSNSITARYNKVKGQASDYYILIYITKYTYTLLVVFDTFLLTRDRLEIL